MPWSPALFALLWTLSVAGVNAMPPNSNARGNDSARGDDYAQGNGSARGNDSGRGNGDGNGRGNGNPRGGLALGREVFLTYCTGCHGFDGMAFFEYAPSFAMGERLQKSDAELMNSILNGLNAMPAWDGKLPRRSLEQSLAYIRHMARTGKFEAPKNWTGPYFIFAPLGTDPTVDWQTQ